jgi:hypothetical protein
VVRAAGPLQDSGLAEGTRLGRYVVVRDVNGRRHALAATAVVAISEEEDGDIVLFLPGGRALRISVPLATVLDWLNGQH